MTSTLDHLPADWLTLVATTERRNGPVELCPDPECYDTDFCQVNIHKVRLLYIDEHGHWIVERPFAMDGQPAIKREMNVLGILGSGSHRWSFRATVDAAVRFQLNERQRLAALRLTPPHDVKSAQRRAFFRISVLSSSVPPVVCWPLLDLSSTIEPERANEQLHRDDKSPVPPPPPPTTDEPFNAALNDLSGNGLSLIVEPQHMELVEQNPLLWIKLDLPTVAHPLLAVVRHIRHQIDSTGRHVVGFAFQYSHHRAHEPFICDNICKWAAAEQRRQLQRTR